MIDISVHSTEAVIRSQEKLTVGLRGAKVRFTFAEPWGRLIKTAVFRQGDKTVALSDIGTEVTIPWEVLTLPGVPVQIGVYGTDASETVAIPTLWAETDPVLPGTDPEGDPSTEPTPGLWEQMQSKLGSLEQLQTADRTSLVAAINEANRPVCMITVTNNQDGTYTADHDVGMIDEMLNAKIPFVCYWYDEGMALHLADYQTKTGYTFTGITGGKEYSVTISSNGDVDCKKTELVPVRVTVTQNEDGTYKVNPGFTQIMDAYNNGHDVNCQYGNTVLPLSTVTNVFCIFSSIHNGVEYMVQVGASNVKVTTRQAVQTVNGITPDRYGNVAMEIPTKVSQLENDSGFLTEAPVTSVNGKTGKVSLDIPSKVSQLENDSGFLTEAPVTSVNGKTGNVELELPTKVSQLENDSGYLTEAPGTLLVTVTGTSDGGYSADCDPDDIQAALDDHQPVVCCWNDEGVMLYLSAFQQGGPYIFTAVDGPKEYRVVIRDTEDIACTVTNLSQESILYTPQTLTEEQKAQARENIGVSLGGVTSPTTLKVTVTGTSDGGYSADCDPDDIQAALDDQQLVVCYWHDEGMMLYLSAFQQGGPYIFTAIDGPKEYRVVIRDTEDIACTVTNLSQESILYTPQTLTEEQKAQARENIGAASLEELPTGGTGGAAGGTFHFEFTLEEDKPWLYFNFPVNWGKILQYNVNIHPVISAEMATQLYTGGAYRWSATYSPNIKAYNLYGIYYQNDGYWCNFAMGERTADNAADTCTPEFPPQGNKHMAIMQNNEFSINSKTEGVVFQAGTKVDVWGVYAE